MEKPEKLGITIMQYIYYIAFLTHLEKKLLKAMKGIYEKK